MLAWIWSDPLRSAQQKSRDALELIDAARKAGDPALANELHAQSLLDQHKTADAAVAFAEAVKSGDRSPELYLNFAAAVDSTGNLAGAQQLLWKLVSDRPFCSEAYVELYALCEKDAKPQEARRMLSAWLTADPDSVAAARATAREAFAARRFSDTERILLDLFDRHDNDPGVLAALQEFYTQTDQLPELMTRLRERLAKEPWNFTLAEVLAQTDADQQRTSDAVAVIDRMRRTFGDDPDLLYEISGLYARAGQNAAAEQVLQQVLKLDPSYAGASNDLAYTWAEQGRNLDEAEALVRQAVNAEPDNPSFLDSMGWVLYKRGKFAEALPHLAKAAQPDGQADPIVLDHLGDTLYRLGDRDQAARRWQQAVSHIGQSRDDANNELKELRAQLLRKRQQLEAHQPVSVAPVAGQQ
jgi:Tfp pilus assembly protein PilF